MACQRLKSAEASRRGQLLGSQDLSGLLGSKMEPVDQLPGLVHEDRHLDLVRGEQLRVEAPFRPRQNRLLNSCQSVGLRTLRHTFCKDG